MALSDYIVTDDLTIILALAAAGLFVLHNLYKPQSLVHPILLGRQSDVARVRNPGESAVCRNYGTGMLGRFPMRPTKDQQVLLDLVRPDADAPRTLWSTKITNPQLRERAAAFGNGLIEVVGLVPKESNVLLLLNDSIEFIIADLALASNSIPSFTLNSLSLLSPVLDTHPPSAIITHAQFLPFLLELIYDSRESSHHKIIVVGEPDGKDVKDLPLFRFDEIEREGVSIDSDGDPADHVPDPGEVFTVAFSASPSGELQGAELTHENLTAGVAAARALLPLSSAISPLDTIASAFSLSTPYGRAIAYTAIYEGTSFATLDSAKVVVKNGRSATTDLEDLFSMNSLPVPSPTLYFVKPSHLDKLASAVIEEAKKSSSWIMYNLAWRHKFAGLLEGFLTKQSLWDRLVFDAARVKVMGKGAGTVRGIVVSGGNVDAQALTPARIALSVPLVNAYSHPLVAGPVLASHPLDLQTFPLHTQKAGQSAADAFAFTYTSPVGPPSVNIEAKLVGVDDPAVENGADPVGALYVRGPSVGKLLNTQDSPVQEENAEDKGWVNTGDRAKVAPNGTFKVVSVVAKGSST
ncbi:acetyl-CoA synthetase-like protein [Obba rivulosa]|uniref:Acetyl-CoA synthetase-like protein n=1 Tax=Obba rivulosa TaxID=1052685 RepID=A0A8E2DTD3_9APHY|nr:acetyl-CoA synthetase-like protein [Obba rivulosa]